MTRAGEIHLSGYDFFAIHTKMLTDENPGC